MARGKSQIHSAEKYLRNRRGKEHVVQFDKPRPSTYHVSQALLGVGGANMN